VKPDRSAVNGLDHAVGLDYFHRSRQCPSRHAPRSARFARIEIPRACHAAGRIDRPASKRVRGCGVGHQGGREVARSSGTGGLITADSWLSIAIIESLYSQRDTEKCQAFVRK
jgi:hypothetical protein